MYPQTGKPVLFASGAFVAFWEAAAVGATVAFWVGSWVRAKPSHDYKLRIFSTAPPNLHSLEKGEGLKKDLIIDQAHVMKLP